MDKLFFGEPLKFFIKVPENIKNYKGSNVLISSDKYNIILYPIIVDKVAIKDCANFILQEALIFPGIGGLEIASLYNDFKFLKSGECIYSLDLLKGKISLSLMKEDKSLISFNENKLNQKISKGYLIALDILVD